MEISYEDFKKVNIKVGTVLEVKKNEKARNPAQVNKVDFGKVNLHTKILILN